MDPKLDQIIKMLNHQYDMLHGIAAAIADIAQNLAGAMTADDVKQVTERLKKHAAVLEGIAANKPTT